MKTLITIALALCITSNAQARDNSEVFARSSENSSRGQIIRLAPEYKDPPVVEQPQREIKGYEETSVRERTRDMNSYCAGYYSAKSLGEMGTISSLAGLVFKNSYSADQKLAVRLFTEHSNAYKRQGGISQEFYDLGGRLGGQIWMSGTAQEDGQTFTQAEIESTCLSLRKGNSP